MLTTRQYLRTLSKDELKRLFNAANLTKIEYDLLKYAYIYKYLRDKTCLILHIQKTKYHSILNEALIKIDFTLKNLQKVRI